MLSIYIFALAIFGIILILSSFSILARNKSMIEIPSLFIRNRKKLNSKYRFHTHFLFGIILIFYSVCLYELGISYLPIHFLTVVITYIGIDGLGYFKFY